ncbi:MAG: transcription antitermination factor NusB [Deltaproteobacteria bacterium]|nr:transcription antitermination factor NusB [Deltaproteobacteria bacterium]
MKSRRKAREAALQALYQCDTLGEFDEACIDLYFKVFKTEACDPSAPLEGTQKENLEFCRALLSGVISSMSFIDSQISSASTNWSINRMCRVDRNILRLAVFEIAFMEDIPVSVSINEAIEIAKSYGTVDSPMFINGVLDNVAGVLDQNPELVTSALALVKKVAVNG